MRSKKSFLFYPLIILFALFIVPYFFSLDIPGQIKSELDAALMEYTLPNNPKYVKYQNDEWGVSFEYPSHMKAAGGPTENDLQYAIFFYGLGEEHSGSNIVHDDSEMFGVHLLKNRSFDEEVTRVGGDRVDLREEFDLNGYQAVRINEHVNPITGMREESIVVDKEDMVASFFIIRRKDDEDMRSYFDHMIKTFKFDIDVSLYMNSSKRV